MEDEDERRMEARMFMHSGGTFLQFQKKKCNFQTTKTPKADTKKIHPPIPKADTMVEKPNPVQNKQKRFKIS